MKATIAITSLQDAIHTVQRAVSSRAQLPILLHLNLRVEKDTLCIRGTDLEIGIESSLPITEAEEGEVSVPAKQLGELVGALSGEGATLATEDATLRLTTKKTKTKLQVAVGEEYPKLFLDKGEQVIRLPLSSLRSILASVVFSASTDTTRANLSGVLISPSDDGLLFVATDGYRLSLKKEKGMIGEKSIRDSLLVPARVLRELLSLKDDTKEVAFFTSRKQNQIIFEMEGTLLVGRLIDANFPPYEKIIPTDVGTSAEFDREEMLKAVRMCSVFARDGANIITFSLKSNAIIVSSHAASLGENAVEVEAVVRGEENEIAFNVRYALEVLQNLSQERLRFEMTGPLNPGVFKLAGDDSYLHLVMPIKTQG